MIGCGLVVSLLSKEDAVRLFVLNLSSWTPPQQNYIRTNVGSLPGALSHAVLRGTLDAKYGLTDSALLGEIAELTGMLPLAIVQCASYLRRYPMGYSEYIEKFKARSRKTRERFYSHGPMGVSYNESIMTTWEVSFEHIARDLPSAGKMLTMFGFLERTGISRDFLEAALENLTFWNGNCTIALPSRLQKKFNFLNAQGGYSESLGLLQSISLIIGSLDKRQISIHPMVHEWIHLRLPSPVCAQWLTAVITLLYHRLPPLIYSGEDSQVPHQADVVLCHLRRCKELLELYFGSLQKLPPEIPIFFLEGYLWYRGVDYLAFAEKVAAKTRQEDKKWVMRVVCATQLLEIIQDFQGSHYGELDSDRCEQYSDKLALLSRANYMAPTGTRFVLTEATVAYRLIELVREDMQVTGPFAINYRSIQPGLATKAATHLATPREPGITRRVAMAGEASISPSTSRSFSSDVTSALIGEAATHLATPREPGITRRVAMAREASISPSTSQSFSSGVTPALIGEAATHLATPRGLRITRDALKSVPDFVMGRPNSLRTVASSLNIVSSAVLAYCVAKDLRFRRDIDGAYELLYEHRSGACLGIEWDISELRDYFNELFTIVHSLLASRAWARVTQTIMDEKAYHAFAKSWSQIKEGFSYASEADKSAIQGEIYTRPELRHFAEALPIH